jgi:ABC-type antimicrobial peptide transport system, ATPase component
MELLEKEIELISKETPYVTEFFRTYRITPPNPKVSLGKYLDSLTDEYFEDIGMDKTQLVSSLAGFLEMAKEQNEFQVQSITIIGGHDKNGKTETLTLTLESGTITSIVGPTGSGKSRLLADIEWMAQGDTPTGRAIWVNGVRPDPELRFSLEHKLVAQLSQNMNFVMDTTVEEFVTMHAESRLIENPDEIVTEIIRQANLLAGESFTGATPVTALSGGQSRALMIADTAFLSSSPVVLIDEIENAGIDRKKALSLLVKKEKIVLMATHDPILALMAEQRLVIKNGGIQKVIRTSNAEKANLAALEALDNKILALRNSLRNGEVIEGEF